MIFFAEFAGRDLFDVELSLDDLCTCDVCGALDSKGGVDVLPGCPDLSGSIFASSGSSGPSSGDTGLSFRFPPAKDA